MFISHDYKFIFIKTRKTAGSSIEKFFLDKLRGTNLIFAGMPPEKLSPINCNFNRIEHCGSDFIKGHFPVEWKDYYKITIERNPWDKMVSLFHWQKSVKPKYNIEEFKDYIKNRKNLWYKNDWELYTEKNNPCVDKIIQYDNLNEEMNLLCQYLGIDYNNELNYIKLKGNHRKNKNYREYYSSETKSIIESAYLDTINYFGYEF